MSPHEGVMLDEAVRVADAFCARLELTAGESRTFVALLELAEADRDALIVLQGQTRTARDGALERVAEADAVLGDLRAIAAGRHRAVPGSFCAGSAAREKCVQSRTHATTAPALALRSGCRAVPSPAGAGPT